MIREILTIIFISSFFVTGALEAYAAYKYANYLHVRGGLAVFVWFAASANFDIPYAIITTIYLLINGIPQNSSTDWSNPLIVIVTTYLIVSLFFLRISSGMIALWFVNKTTEYPLRKLLGIAEEHEAELSQE